MSLTRLPSDFAVTQISEMAYPQRVLMCPPDYFDVIDVKNKFMEDQVGRVDKPLARQQWQDLKATFESCGICVEIIPAEKDREDMVFTANQTFSGPTSDGKKICVLSHMRFPSRQKEVPAFEKWFREAGYEITTHPDPQLKFEGGGDALWHPGRRLIWGGIGERTEAKAYDLLGECFQCPIMLVKMRSPFYHLDTCLSLLDEKTALVYPEAFEPESLELIAKLIPRLIKVSAEEASDGFVCNAAAFLGKHVVLQKGADRVNRKLTEAGFSVRPVETGEFIKSGGSVYCMKMSLF